MDTPDERIEKRDQTEDKVSKVQSCYREARKHQRKWRSEAIENYDFREGRQWSEEDRKTLEEEGRPMVTFNRMGPYFDAVAGTEINNRQEIKYLARTLGDQRQIEILNAATKWVLERTNANDEESDAFQDCLVTGMGFIETRMEYDEDPDGKIVIERIDPLEMTWDPRARKRNLQDANWLQRTKWLSKAEIEDRWPDVELGTSSTPWGDEGEDKVEPHNANLAFLYRENSTESYDQKSGKWRVVQHLYWDWDTVYRVQDPMTGKLVNLSKDKYTKLIEVMPGLQAAKLRQKVYKYIFIIGDQVPEDGDLKCGFNIKAITGKRDQNTGLWYGLARSMKDPQRWANKFLAQIMHIINSNAKGGLLAETGAFVDPKKAQDDWSDPSAVVLLKNGGIGKVKERVASNYPQGLDKLLQFAIASIPDATGINLEFMGMQERSQANVLEETRKKSAFVILAVFFDSLRLYRKEEGRLIAHFIKEYMNDGRIIRITTDQGEQPIELRLDNDVIDYDVIVDQAPDSPNLKEEVWRDMRELVPQMLKAGIPPPPSIFKYSPLPVAVAQEYENAMRGKLPPKAQEAMDGMQKQLQQLGQENQQLKQGAMIKLQQDKTKRELGQQKNMVEAMKVQASGKAGADPESEVDKMRIEAALDEKAEMRALQAEILKEQQKHAQEMERMQREHTHEMELQRRDLIATAAQEQAKIATQEARVFKDAKVEDKDYKGNVQKISKIAEQQTKEIAALMSVITGFTQTIEKLTTRVEKAEEPVMVEAEFTVDRDINGKIKTIRVNHQEETIPPTKFEVERDRGGRIKAVTAIH